MSKAIFNKKYGCCLQRILASIAISIISLSAYATGNIGQVAGNAIEPVGLTSSFLMKVCIVLSIGFIIAGILKFIERRRNSDILLSTPIWLVTFGILLGILVVAQHYASINS